jgi:hypothetical protein
MEDTMAVVAEGLDAVEMKVAVMEASLDAERGQQGRVELQLFFPSTIYFCHSPSSSPKRSTHHPHLQQIPDQQSPSHSHQPQCLAGAT